MAKEDVDWCAARKRGTTRTISLGSMNFVAFYMDCGQLGNSEQKQSVVQPDHHDPGEHGGLLDVF